MCRSRGTIVINTFYIADKVVSPREEIFRFLLVTLCKQTLKLGLEYSCLYIWMLFVASHTQRIVLANATNLSISSRISLSFLSKPVDLLSYASANGRITITMPGEV